MANENLHAAKKAKKDEFYTQLSDIENELRHYKEHFRGKTVFCNCDDPYESNFFKYFAMNFNTLGLKKLIATCYKGSPITGTELHLSSRQAHKITITEVRDFDGNGAVDLADIEFLLRSRKNVLTELKGDGDFRSKECVNLLKSADIVVTNPPFSLFREYVAQLVTYGKKFLIIGPQNAITYKEVFPLIKESKLWLGYGFASGNAYFTVPQSVIDNKAFAEGVYDAATHRVHFRNCHWFTNLDHKKRHEKLILYKKYSEEEYPKYDNYDAINVNKTADIPDDYDGVMGVPITFLDKYNPEQFEIIGATESEGKGFSVGLWNEDSNVAQALVNGKRVYKRIFIRRRGNA